MAAGLFRFSVFVSLLLLIIEVLKPRYEGSMNKDISSMFIAFGRDKVWYRSRNYGLSRQYRTSSCVPSCLKASAGLYLAKLTTCDVSINPHRRSRAILFGRGVMHFCPKTRSCNL